MLICKVALQNAEIVESFSYERKQPKKRRRKNEKQNKQGKNRERNRKKGENSRTGSTLLKKLY